MIKLLCLISCLTAHATTGVARLYEVDSHPAVERAALRKYHSRYAKRNAVFIKELRNVNPELELVVAIEPNASLLYPFEVEDELLPTQIAHLKVSEHADRLTKLLIVVSPELLTIAQIKSFLSVPGKPISPNLNIVIAPKTLPTTNEEYWREYAIHLRSRLGVGDGVVTIVQADYLKQGVQALFLPRRLRNWITTLVQRGAERNNVMEIFDKPRFFARRIEVRDQTDTTITNLLWRLGDRNLVLCEQSLEI